MTAPDRDPRAPFDTADSDAAIGQQAAAWWARLRADDFTQADADALRAWCARSPAHARAWRELQHLWQALAPALSRAAAAPQRTNVLALPARPGRRAFLGGALAAGVAVLALRPPLGAWPSLQELSADYRTGTGEQRQVALSPQMSVQMNTQTRINVRAPEAIELLGGEAEILASGARQPVTVLARAGRLLAQSARFNVRHTDDAVCVTCLAGAVDVVWQQRRQTLDAGQQLVYDDHGVQAATAAPVGEANAWRTGALSFVGQPLSQVVDEINRYRPGRVLLRNAELGRRLVRMRFSIGQTDGALAMIRDLYGAQMTSLPGGIVVLS
ncbi:iron dicitrate transport regulator FecR [Janthinobacterium sp. ROICE36]|uniref:FecR family protein n=1 Tax=Janthinobacterium sp. ROICE36 TaxID=2048670 RepID=UPI000C7ECC66|nr:FecR domain-containing protein [Janthinobacterium sp. ROICE36]PLY45347.1 iron dicitrate transport regulator FecR [Janthinobacterium sp. ROICE36]